MNPALIAVIVVVVAALLFFVIAKVVGAQRRQQSAERKETTLSVLPKTSLGIWSVGLTIAFILLFFLIGVLTGSDPFGFNPILAVVFKIVFVGVPVAILVTGLISMIKRKERSIVVLVSMVVGLWFLIAGLWLGMGGD
jgi:O-antigen/teichoic acid export membrane protein